MKWNDANKFKCPKCGGFTRVLRTRSDMRRRRGCINEECKLSFNTREIIINEDPRREFPLKSQIIAVLKTEPDLPVINIANRLGCSKRSVQKWIKELQLR